eukprot:TRINITY_DN18653_c0_g1_i1.p1 TRINITY_DN18653_c0_g1~~TRINITY_DN18653_c0_g1_i1.p1  ORF type:complete len:847 (+),score=134.76 TRINITY_DN18653_c0_g1_i1:79-2619(+)
MAEEEAPGPITLARTLSADVRRNKLNRTVSGDRPKLIRGYSATAATDTIKLAELVVNCLSDDPGWAAIKDFSTVSIEDKSGMGGAKTFKVTPPEGLDPPPRPCAAALHSREKDGSKEVLMRRMSEATLALSRAGVAPQRLAEGGDWFVESWDAAASSDGVKSAGARGQGQLLARVHDVPVTWFEPIKEQILAENPQASATPAGSHAWLYLSRLAPFDNVLKDPGVYADYVDDTHLSPVSSIAKRVVTVHGDYHPGNTIDAGEGVGFKVVDFEFTHAGSAVFDLTFGLFCCGRENRVEFLEGYTENMTGVTTEDFEEVMVDAELALLYLWLPGGKLAGWEAGSDGDKFRSLVSRCRAFGKWIRESQERKKALIARGLTTMLRESPMFSVLDMMRAGVWYPSVQAKLEAAAEKEQVAADACVELDVAASIASGAQLLVIKTHSDRSKVLQVRPGTSRLELGDFQEGCRNQQWLKVGDSFQHVATALFLDAEVKYNYYERQHPWESCGSELFVLPRDAESGRQDWVCAANPCAEAPVFMIRHKLDGRALDINFCEIQAGSGVNINVPHTTAVGVSWLLEGLNVARPSGTWAEYSNIDMCGQGDACCVHDWKNVTTLEALKRFAEEREYSAVTVSAGTPSFGHAALKKFSYQLTPEHCKPITTCCNHPCTIHIWTPTQPVPVGTARPQVASIAPELPSDAVFAIKVASSRSFCLSYRSDGYTKDPFEVYLAKFDGSDKQKWRLVGGDQIQNVGCGLFMHTDHIHAFLNDLSEIWDGNHSDIVLREQDFSDKQRWVHGPEEFNGGKVLRHYGDGRGVDVHGWQVNTDGGNVGCESSVHADCIGITYVFEAC